MLDLPQHVLSSHRPLANESGETPLDIAKRLRHDRCEELVSLPRWGGGVPLGEGLQEGPEQIPVS